jgi:chromosome partitioning protein
MKNIIAFHSYKGGTGKSTIAANCAAVLAKKGYKVCLLDLDVYAPSLQSYFDNKRSKSITDFLFDQADVQEIMVDSTMVLNGENNIQSAGTASLTLDESSTNRTSSPTYNSMEKTEKIGKLWIGFSNTKKQDIQKLEAGTNEEKKQMFRRLIYLRESLITNYSADYILIDTSPGIRYWSINSLAVADIFLLTLKMGDLDIDGTKLMAAEIYTNFTNNGGKSFLLGNRVAGYCVPHSSNFHLQGNKPSISSDVNIVINENKAIKSYNKPSSSVDSSMEERHSSSNTTIAIPQQSELDFINTLSDEIGMKVISTIPCYCDIQFTRREFLTVLRYPEHPFAKQIDELIKSIQTVK